MPKLHQTPVLFALAGALLVQPAAHAGHTTAQDSSWTFGGFGTLSAVPRARSRPTMRPIR